MTHNNNNNNNNSSTITQTHHKHKHNASYNNLNTNVNQCYYHNQVLKCVLLTIPSWLDINAPTEILSPKLDSGQIPERLKEITINIYSLIFICLSHFFDYI
ncbi:unnamed protein product [Ambrosiozyma monospora]|uniref:Unnamed protein product n=1 Tax=Ambrosiozyma monospora TaxID=43982 RepID=A0A9W6T8N8_AMBMO|nr:unnamed protein product [Ambrosiozyma monospora]